MSRRLGIAVSRNEVRAVVATGDRIVWAGHTAWSDGDALSEAIVTLAAESGFAKGRVCVVFERDLVQFRTILPAPSLSRSAAERYVALEAGRLFRRQGVPLVTAAVIRPTNDKRRALCAAALPETLARAVSDGCENAGLRLSSIGAAADVLLAVMSPRPDQIEVAVSRNEVLSIGPRGVWQSRLLSEGRDVAAAWHPALIAVDPEGHKFGAAFAACRARSSFDLMPPALRRRRRRARRRGWIAAAAIAAIFLLGTVTVSSAKLISSGLAATHMLEQHAGAIDSALAERRELAMARATLDEFAQLNRNRSRYLPLLAELTNTLGDSAFVTRFTAAPGGALQLEGFTSRTMDPAMAVATVRTLRDVMMETRTPSDSRDVFVLRARVVR